MSFASGQVTRLLKKRAKDAGYKYYIYERPCRNGHTSKRLVSSGLCVECSKIRLLRNRDAARKRERQKDGLPEPTRPEPTGCDICGGRTARERVLSIDHCHETGKFRGWLCGNCNRGIGLLGDNLNGVLRAAEYLRYAG